MMLLPALGATAASLGWATGIVLAQRPAQLLGAFEFTRVQLIACAAIMGLLCTVMGYWSSVAWQHWPAFFSSSLIGIILGNLAMIACLRRGGPRRTELLLSLKAVLVTTLAFLWFGETPTGTDIVGSVIALSGVLVAIALGSSNISKSDQLKGPLITTVVLGVLATACQGFGFLALKPALLAGTEPLAATAIRLLGAALLISLIALWPAQPFRAQTQLTPRLLRQTILPGFIGYGVSSSLLLYAFAHMDTGVATVLGSLSPVLVLPILWIKDKQKPALPASVGAVIAVSGTSIIFIF